jgi:hypothetical protein
VLHEVGRVLRREVARRARHICEYCLLREEDSGFPHQIDHIVSLKHGGASVFGNLAYACVPCNRYKGADIASVDRQSGEIVRLFRPRKDRWAHHFRLNGGLIEPRTDVGAATIRLLRLNAQERIAEREALQVLGIYPVR